MNPRTTGLLALIALGLGAFVFLYEIEGDLARESADEEAQKIHPGLEPAAVDAIELVTLDGVAARFERREGGWQVVSPIAARADQTALDAIVNALVNMPREGDVGAAGALEGFGLGPDAPTIRFVVGGETRGLRIGRSTPVGGHRYVARLADDAVAYVASYRVNAFNRNFDDLRDRRIFGFEAGDVRTLRVGWPTESGGDPLEVALAHDDSGQWHLGAPIVDLADQEAVRELLSNLAYLRAADFLEIPDEAEAVRLDPALEAALARTAVRLHWTVEGAHLERTARIAGEVDGQRLVEAPDGRYYWIPAERLEDFPRRIVAYRFKRLSAFEVSAARRLELVFAGAGEGDENAARDLEVVAQLEESGWSSPPPSIDPDRATRMIRELASLDAIEIVAEEMGPDERASLGLEPPRARIRVGDGSTEGEAFEILADLSIGRFDPDRGVFAMRADRPTVFLLAPERAEELPISASRYRADFAIAPADEDAGASDEAAASPTAGQEPRP